MMGYVRTAMNLRVPYKPITYNLSYNELNLYSNFHRNPFSHYSVKSIEECVPDLHHDYYTTDKYDYEKCEIGVAVAATNISRIQRQRNSHVSPHRRQIFAALTETKFRNTIKKFAAAAKKTAQAANLNFNAADSKPSGDTFASVWAHSYTAMYTEALATLRSETFATGANISRKCNVAPSTAASGTSDVAPSSSGKGKCNVAPSTAASGTSDVAPSSSGTTDVALSSSGKGKYNVVPSTAASGTSDVAPSTSGKGNNAPDTSRKSNFTPFTSEKSNVVLEVAEEN
ncbi:hypothetical protein ANN_21055 [Periplaneta americana]|uniref:Uncharacterized protein n=1 Tax=Periplaneta americana TaxID=6978 RepID=A0ABQ8SF65_PERAM|nr:hypothetical protein ANN_21055 [Periplaneta americana]